MCFTGSYFGHRRHYFNAIYEERLQGPVSNEHKFDGQFTRRAQDGFKRMKLPMFNPSTRPTDILHNQCIITCLTVSHAFMAEHLNRPFMDSLALSAVCHQLPLPPSFARGYVSLRSRSPVKTLGKERHTQTTPDKTFDSSHLNHDPPPRSLPGTLIAKGPNNGAEMSSQES